MLHVFIDTNIYLSFYHFNNSDLIELEKLVELVSTKQIILYLTDQVRDEIERNREIKIAESMKSIKEDVRLTFPHIYRTYPEYREILKNQAELNENLKKLRMSIREDILNRTLKADEVIFKLFNYTTELKLTDDIYTRSRKRVDIGNPPGKNKSLGDAINWELLLANVNEDVVIVSADGDYSSVVAPQQVMDFLSNEWKDKKKKNITLFTDLNSFFNKHIKNIVLETERKKISLIDSLKQSGSFSETHRIIYELSGYSDFTDEQIFTLAKACAQNNQVYSIILDDDVERFVKQIILPRKEVVDKIDYTQLVDVLSN